MALQSSDLFVVQRPGDKHYHVKVSDVKTVPDGNQAGDILKWSASGWEASDFIDCGEYS